MNSLFSALAVAILISTPVWSAEEGMLNMPRLQPKKSYTVPNQEAGDGLLEQRGYGDQEPMVRMMNLMMVGGSGYEGMDMATMTADAKNPGASPAEGQTATFDVDAQMTPNPPKVGTNILVIGIQRKSDAKPAAGLKIKAQVSMTSMDMGTEELKISEVAPGRYQVKAVFSMKGPWAVKLLLPEGGVKVLNFDVGSAK